MHLRCPLHPLEAESRSPISCLSQWKGDWVGEMKLHCFPRREDDSSGKARFPLILTKEKRSEACMWQRDNGQITAWYHPAPPEEQVYTLSEVVSSDSKSPLSLTLSHQGKGQLFERGDDSRTRGNGLNLKEQRFRLDVRGSSLL